MYRQMRDEVARQPSRRQALSDDGRSCWAAGNCRRPCGRNCRRRDSATEILAADGPGSGAGSNDERDRRAAAAADHLPATRRRKLAIRNSTGTAMRRSGCTVCRRPTRGSALHFLAPAPLRLPDFDAVSPFGADKTRTLLISQIVPADAASRERFVDSLARSMRRLMIDGGWLLPLGQEAALAPLAKVFRRLPAEPFETVPPAATRSEQPQELVVRTLCQGRQDIFLCGESDALAAGGADSVCPARRHAADAV